jgi:PAS domain S-box-containing protein
MKKEQSLPADAAELRRRAEERLQTREQTPQSTPDTQRLVHELEVHQIELEMQNEELQQAHARAEALLAQYTGLYDFALAGYFTLARESEERFRTLVDTVPAAIFIQTNGCFAYVNAAALQLFGATQPAELLGQPVVNRTHPDYRAKTMERIRLLNERQQRAGASDLVYLTLDGSVRNVITSAVPFNYQNQNGALVFVMDITERKQAEEALQKQNRFIQTILEHAPIGFAVNTINDGAIQYVNARFEEIYGVPRGALRAVEDFFDLVYPDPVYREQLRARIMADLASGDPARMRWEDVPFTTRSGESKVVTAVNIPLLDQNLMVSTVMDVTDRKRAEAALRKSEERLRFALQRSYTGGWDLDLVDHTAHRTLEHDRIFGYPSLLPRWTYEMFLEHVLPEDRAEVDRLFRQAVAAQTDWGFECRIRRADAEVRWIWAAGGHQRDEQGKARRMAGIVQDITERKRAEEALRVLNAELEHRVRERTAQLAATNQQLEASNKELEAFSYSVSHDLRAPLRHVLGYAEMLTQEAGDQLSEAGRRYLKTITDASKEMGELIDDLLSFSRMARVEMRETRVELDTLGQKTLRELETAATGRNIVWKIPPLPVVQGDPAMLKQVFVNLLGNAVKYTRPRDPAEIELGYAGAEDGRIILFVRDNGVGFDPQYAHKLFGVFQRLHRADEFEGTGIGLANVRRIIARHGGRTWAEGKVNEGATFYFTLKPSADPAK